MAQFRDKKTVKKLYHALTFGQGSGDVRCRLSAINPKNGTVKIVQKSGKDSYDLLFSKKYYGQYDLSLMECRPVTGRSHQIRVHLASRKLAIVGDKVYGEQSRSLPKELSALVSHHFLHARTLEFLSPSTGRKVQVKAPYPKTWQEFRQSIDV